MPKNSHNRSLGKVDERVAQVLVKVRASQAVGRPLQVGSASVRYVERLSSSPLFAEARLTICPAICVPIQPNFDNEQTKPTKICYKAAR
jgi:hypothetical protein